MKYLEIFKDINYLSYAGAFAKWIFLFLLISIILLIVGNKLKWFCRERKFANILAKGYYIIIPLYFIFFAIKFAPIKNTQNEFNRLVDDNKAIITEFTHSFLDSIHIDSSQLENTSLKEIVDNQIVDFVAKMKIEKAKKYKIGSKIIEDIKGRITINFLSKLLESKIVEKSSKLIGIENKSGQKIYKTSFYELFAEGEIVEVFRMELNKIFTKMYKSFFIVFGIGLLFLSIEILLAKRFKY